MKYGTLEKKFFETIYIVSKIQPAALILSEDIIRYLKANNITEVHNIFLCNVSNNMEYIVLSVYSKLEKCEFLFRFDRKPVSVKIFIKPKNLGGWLADISATTPTMLFRLME